MMATLTFSVIRREYISVRVSDVQAGRIGEYLLAVYAMLTSDGQLVPFQVDADDDHRDLVVAVKGKSAFASLQAKACFELGVSGFVQSNATYKVDTIPRDPAWIYVIHKTDGGGSVGDDRAVGRATRPGRLPPARLSPHATPGTRRPCRARLVRPTPRAEPSPGPCSRRRAGCWSRSRTSVRAGRSPVPLRGTNRRSI